MATLVHGKGNQMFVTALRQAHSIFVMPTPSFRLGVARPEAASMSVLRAKYSSDSTRPSKRERNKLKLSTKPPSGGTADWVGPPDPTSNIRPIKFYIPPNETAIEKEFRLRREDTLEWNHNFWTEHNAKFFKEKELYVQANKSEDSKKVSPEQMALFYEKFLDDNRQEHLKYNKEWYRRNISLLWPAFKASLIHLRRKMSRTK